MDAVAARLVETAAGPVGQAGPEPISPARSGRGGEPLTFAAVHAAHAAFVWRALRRLGVREAEVEDACQEVFVVVHRRLADFDGSSQLRTWLFGICLRVASEFRRRAHARRELVTAEPPEGEVAATQPEEAERRRARRLLDAILDALDDDKRAVFVLFELEQLPMAEVCALVGCPLQTAYSRLHAARRHVEAAVRREQLKRGEGANATR